jgi:hypothetical protein
MHRGALPFVGASVSTESSSKTTNQDIRMWNIPKKQRRESAIARAYAWFLELPIPIVLATMWLAGATLISVCGLVLYFLWLSLQTVAGG